MLEHSIFVGVLYNIHIGYTNVIYELIYRGGGEKDIKGESERDRDKWERE